jgi:hypothetical protein
MQIDDDLGFFNEHSGRPQAFAAIADAFLDFTPHPAIKNRYRHTYLRIESRNILLIQPAR